MQCLGAGKHVLQEKPIEADFFTAKDAISKYRSDPKSSWSLAENYRYCRTVKQKDSEHLKFISL